MKKFSRKNISIKKRQNKKHKKSRRKFGGEHWTETAWKYTMGEKRKEIVPQVQSIVQGVREGYGLGGIGGWTDLAWDNGGAEYLLTVPLSSIILWHPVRGPGERAQAGVKTTKRADETYKVLMNSLSSTRNPDIPVVTYSRQKPLTFQQIDTIPEMASNDAIKICPVNIKNNDDDADEEMIRTYANGIDGIPTTINKLGYQSKTASRIRQLENIKTTYINTLQNLLYRNNKYEQYFLVLSGQGRLQAIIEAVKNANIPPNQFFIKLVCKDIYLDLCNTLIKIHNSWVRKGDFNDSEHRHDVYFNGEWIPMEELPLAFSCSKNRSKKDTECFSKYYTGNVRSKNMGCSDIYDYRIPYTRYFTE